MRLLMLIQSLDGVGVDVGWHKPNVLDVSLVVDGQDGLSVQLNEVVKAAVWSYF